MRKDNDNETLYLSTIAFFDDESITTNQHYLFEFCKMVIFQNSYVGLNASEIHDKILELVLLDYTEEEIKDVISSNSNGEIVLHDEIYTISSAAEKDIIKREKSFILRKYVDYYCDIKYKDEVKIDRNRLCSLLTKFIFEKFRESMEQISNIIDGHCDFQFEYSNDYSDEDKDFINNFLSWDNEEKNIIIYKMIVKSYDFCILNCPETASLNFEKFNFHLDSNIIMRLLGINNTYRQNAVKYFIEKCTHEKINLHISSFTKMEIQKSIERQVLAVGREIEKLGYLQSPDAMKFAKPDSFTIELYGKYFEYCKKNKTSSLEGFKRSLFTQLDNCIRLFNYDDENSFEILSPELFMKYFASLKTIKDENVVKTDVNNILLILANRENNPDEYMISADGKLIEWCKSIFIGKTSIVELPSVWLSLIMKYTGRTSGEDYASFCKFIRLPIHSYDKDIRRKIDIRNHVSAMDISSKIKDRMFEELNNNFCNYSLFSSTSEEITNIVYDKIMHEHEQLIRDEEANTRQKEIERLNELHERKNAGIIQQIKEKESTINEVKNNSVEVRIEAYLEEIIQKRIEIGKWINDYFNCIMILIIVFISVLIYILYSKKIQSLEPIILTIIIPIAEFLISVVIKILLNATKEYYINSERLRKKIKNKLEKKYKKLLK